MSSLRLNKTRQKYHKHIKNKKDDNCPICLRKGLKEFKFWKIIKNHFPYDRIADKHNMIVPIRHTTEDKLNRNELSELLDIKRTYIKDSDYNYILEANGHTKSIPAHFHLHLIRLK